LDEVERKFPREGGEEEGKLAGLLAGILRLFTKRSKQKKEVKE
jgi:hypothetical protein